MRDAERLANTVEEKAEVESLRIMRDRMYTWREWFTLPNAVALDPDGKSIRGRAQLHGKYSIRSNTIHGEIDR